MTRIVALVGDYYHQAEWAEETLRKAVDGLNGAELHFIQPYAFLEALQGKPDAVVLFKEDRLQPNVDESLLWMTAEVQRAISDYTAAGGSWLGWHSGLASYDPAGAYVGMLRGHFLSHPNEHQSVTYTEVENELGFTSAAPFAILDEHYFVTVDEANTDVFLRSSSVDGNSVAGWAHCFGEGRVACFTPAHRYEGLQHEAVVGYMNRLLAWCVER
jgi:type 1 glutamine amidotransferase